MSEPRASPTLLTRISRPPNDVYRAGDHLLNAVCRGEIGGDGQHAIGRRRAVLRKSGGGRSQRLFSACANRDAAAFFERARERTRAPGRGSSP